jgi:hypothetical protein
MVGADADVILGALRDGHPVIAHMGKGTFTNDGHYIVLRGIAEDGKIFVNDPNSSSRSQKTYSLDLIMREAKTFRSFMVCTRADGTVPALNTTSEPTATPESTEMPEATITSEPTVTPETTMTPEPTATPEPMATPEATAMPEPTVTLEPMVKPEATITPEATAETNYPADSESTMEPDADANEQSVCDVDGFSLLASSMLPIRSFAPNWSRTKTRLDAPQRPIISCAVRMRRNSFWCGYG